MTHPSIPGRLVTFEGIDSSGKRTQTNLLNERLIAERVAGAENPPALYSFPDYQTPYGRLIADYLAGKHPVADPYYISLLFAADRSLVGETIKAHLEKGTWVLCDRYVESNLGHQTARIDEPARDAYVSWLFHTEYDIFNLPRPDTTILLDVNPEVSFLKAAQRAEIERKEGNSRRSRCENGKDIHEENLPYLQEVRRVYLEYALELGWAVISCTEGEEFLPQSAIAERVYAAITQRLLS